MRLLSLLIVSLTILYQNVSSLKPNYCQIQEEYFEYVPKTIMLRERKDRKENKGILSYFNPRNFFRKDEFQNVAKTVMVAEKQVRTVTECCRGFVQVKGDCVPKEEEQKTGKKVPSTVSPASTSTDAFESKMTVSVTPLASMETTAVVLPQTTSPETSLAEEDSNQQVTASSEMSSTSATASRVDELTPVKDTENVSKQVTTILLDTLAQSATTIIADEMDTKLEPVSLTAALITTVANLNGAGSDVSTGTNKGETSNEAVFTQPTLISSDITTSEPAVEVATIAKGPVLTVLTISANSATTTESIATSPKISFNEVIPTEPLNTFPSDTTTVTTSESITAVVDEQLESGSTGVVSASSQAEQIVTQFSTSTGKLPEEGNEFPSSSQDDNEQELQTSNPAEGNNESSITLRDDNQPALSTSNLPEGGNESSISLRDYSEPALPTSNLLEGSNESSSSLREDYEQGNETATTESMITSPLTKRDEVTLTVTSLQPDLTTIISVEESIQESEDPNLSKQPVSNEESDRGSAVEALSGQTEQTVAQFSLDNGPENGGSSITIREGGQPGATINGSANLITIPDDKISARDAKREVDSAIDDFPNNEVETDFPRISSTESAVSNRKAPFSWAWWLQILNILTQFLKRFDVILF